MEKEQMLTRTDDGVEINLTVVAKLLKVPVDEEGGVNPDEIINASWDFLVNTTSISGLSIEERAELYEATERILEVSIGSRRGQGKFS